MSTKRPLAGTILCGGAGRRMGGVDKARLVVGRSTLLERAVARLAPVADPLIIATGRAPLAAADVTDLGARARTAAGGRRAILAVTDVEAGSGPVAGLVAALRACPHQLCAVVAVDMPALDAALLRRMCEEWDGEDAVVPRDGHGVQPLHSLVARSLLVHAEPVLRAEDRSLRALFAAARVREVDAGALGAAPGFAANLNTRADVTAWLAAEDAGRPRPPL